MDGPNRLNNSRIYSTVAPQLPVYYAKPTPCSYVTVLPTGMSPNINHHLQIRTFAP